MLDIRGSRPRFIVSLVLASCFVYWSYTRRLAGNGFPPSLDTQPLASLNLTNATTWKLAESTEFNVSQVPDNLYDVYNETLGVGVVNFAAAVVTALTVFCGTVPRSQRNFPFGKNRQTRCFRTTGRPVWDLIYTGGWCRRYEGPVKGSTIRKRSKREVAYGLTGDNKTMNLDTGAIGCWRAHLNILQRCA
jgi:hypothetical protein